MSAPFYVHIVGTGTIGEPLIGLIIEATKLLGLNIVVSFHKATVSEKAKILALIGRGAEFASSKEDWQVFKDYLELSPHLSRSDALNRANVIIDCTPYGNKIKDELYCYLNDGKRRFAAQGSEDGFGIKFASGINNDFVYKALWEENVPFYQIVSCNTHNLLALIQAIAFEEGKYGLDELVHVGFTLLRRIGDVSQPKAIPAPEIGYYDDEIFGTHQAADAANLYKESFGFNLAGKIISSAHKMPTPYMHGTEFRLVVRRKIDYPNVVSLFTNSWRYAVTEKRLANQVFAFGRDHGFFGRILNQSVIVIAEERDKKKKITKRTLRVADHPNGTEIDGNLLTPQDGNSLLTSFEFIIMSLFKEEYKTIVSNFISQVPVRFKII